MRIAIVTTSWPGDEGDPCGHFVRAEARELERGGHAVEVVAPRGGAFGWPGVAARLRERPLRAIDAARWVAAARARVRRLDVERVVAHWAVPCAWPVGLAARGAELEIVSHGGDVRLLAGMPRVVRRRLVRALAARSMCWRFVSQALQRELCDVLDPETREAVARIAVVRAPSVEVPDVGEAVARRARELAGRRVAVSVGRLVRGKRVDRAIEHVARARDLDALVVVGDGPERPRLEALARARGVDATFVGLVPREEALAWIGAAEVVLHASQEEGLSTVLREAETLGTRVVVV
ncbi:MAG TPA: glycosyltransferase family 4 protein [Polyangiaceae bacterium]|jgi:glycosyltransferase involved in cell wall biosynthesis